MEGCDGIGEVWTRMVSSGVVISLLEDINEADSSGELAHNLIKCGAAEAKLHVLLYMYAQSSAQKNAAQRIWTYMQ